MKRNVLRTNVQEHIGKAGGDVQEGLKSFRLQMEDLIENHKVTLEHVSLGNLFEAMCNPDGAIDKNSSQAVSEAMMAAGMPNLVGKLLHPVFMSTYEPLSNKVLPLVTQVTSQHQEENVPGFGAHDGLELVHEKQMYEESQPLEKYAKIVNHKFGRKISVTMEAVIFDQTGNVLNKAKEIGVKAGTHLHTYIVQKMCDIAVTATGEAVNTSLVINGTARAMYADTHVAWDNYANDNLGSGALGTSGMIAALTLLNNIKDEKGDFIMINPKFLVVPVALEVVAKQLILSPTQFDQTDRSINVFYNSYNIVSSPVIDAGVSATAWYLGDPAMQTRLQWVYKPKTETLTTITQASFDSDIVAQFKIGYFAGVGCTDYRYVIKGNA